MNGYFDNHPLDFNETIYELNYSTLDLGFDGFCSIYDHDYGHCPFDYGLIVLNPKLHVGLVILVFLILLLIIILIIILLILMKQFINIHGFGVLD